MKSFCRSPTTYRFTSTEETRHIINENALRHDEPNAYLINTSRGPVVEEAGSSRCIAGAGLDVWRRSHLTATIRCSRWTMLLLSPHSGHTSVLSLQLRTRYGEDAAVLDGKKPRNIVNPQSFWNTCIWYRV